MNDQDKNEIEKKFKEIEDLQNEFDKIFTNRNVLVKMFNYGKAKRLHLLAEKKYQELMNT